jgi:alpha-L-fucosidase
MYDSPSSDYDIVDATPYARDPMAPLAKACKKYGVQLCFYYSQDQDWHDPDGTGNDWDYPHQKDFARYLREKVKPQLRELLTQYGPVGLIWFDTPLVITKSQSQDLKRFVHRLQPNCLVSGRVGHGVGDYGSMGDNQIPAGRVEGDWETPATLNDTWGFKTDDHEWKTTEYLLKLLVDLASKGVNYLLNIGPTAQGTIPPESVKRLREIGRWMRVNGQAIYGTQASPFPYEFDWGRITCKPGKLYLHFYKWPGERFKLVGLRNKVSRARLLAGGAAVGVTQSHDATRDEYAIELSLPRRAPDRRVSVVELQIAGTPNIEPLPLQQPDGSILLPAFMGRLRRAGADDAVKIDHSGIVQNWRKTGTTLAWTFKLSRPGTYAVQVLTTAAKYQPWKGGHQLVATVGSQQVKAIARDGEQVTSPRTRYFEERASTLGTIDLTQAGRHTLRLQATRIAKAVPVGVAVSAVRLVRV